MEKLTMTDENGIVYLKHSNGILTKISGSVFDVFDTDDELNDVVEKLAKYEQLGEPDDLYDEYDMTDSYNSGCEYGFNRAIDAALQAIDFFKK